MKNELAKKVILKQDFADMKKGEILTLKNNDYWGHGLGGRSIYIHSDLVYILPNIFEKIDLLAKEQALAKRLNLTVEQLRDFWYIISTEVFINAECEAIYNDWVEREKIKLCD